MAEMFAARLSSTAQGMTPVEVGGVKLLLVRDGVVLAALTCAHDRATALLSQALRSRLTLAEARRLVAMTPLALASHSGPDRAARPGRG